MLFLIDVSENQGDINFKEVASSKEIDGVYIRASQGMTITDSKFAEYHDGFKSVGIPVGAYHFLMMTPNGGQQAQHFLSVIRGREGDLLPMVDIEEGSMEGSSDLGSRMQTIHSFNQCVLTNLPCSNVLIYTDLNFWNTKMSGTSAFQGHKLFVAEYNNDKAPALPGGFLDWTMWQFSDKGKIPGISQNFVDLNHLNSDSLDVIKRG